MEAADVEEAVDPTDGCAGGDLDNDLGDDRLAAANLAADDLLAAAGASTGASFGGKLLRRRLSNATSVTVFIVLGSVSGKNG